MSGARVRTTRRRSATIAGAVFTAALLALCVAVIMRMVWALWSTGQAGAIVLGAAIMVFPLVALWFIVQEFRFGYRATELVDLLAEEGPLPTDQLEASPSGRFDREEARRLLPDLEQRAAEPGARWQDLLRLSLVQDASGQRRDARRSAMAAIRARLPLD